MVEAPCFYCGQGEPDHVDGRCDKYRPGDPNWGSRYGWLSADGPQLAAFLAQTAANAATPSEPDDINDLRARAATAAFNAEALTARWTAVVNDEIGGWAVSINGRTPAAGGRMAADMVMTRELADHIADVHNQWLNRHNTGVPVATGFITTVDVSTPWWTLWVPLVVLAVLVVLGLAVT